MPTPTLTGSSLFLKTLSDCGITHAFVNWGSDHPALLEDLERQRVESGRTRLNIITCPNEMVALSAAQGFAQAVGKPAAVIIHVDVGTQALAGAVHNVDRGRTPVLIYAGGAPFSSNGEHRGGRNEWIMWPQDVPDQSAIVRQYMRYTAQILSGKTIPHYVRRALQISMSEPKGPVYLWARREPMEEEVSPSLMEAHAKDLLPIIPVEPCALSDSATQRIASALLTSQHPLIITSYLGRNEHAVPALLALASLLAIPIVSACPSAVNVPFDCPEFAGVTYLFAGTHSKHLAKADVILVIDCVLPWIPENEKPSPSARVFILDGGDPLKLNMGDWSMDAEMICRADAEHALTQIFEAVRVGDHQLTGAAGTGDRIVKGGGGGNPIIQKRKKALEEDHLALVKELEVQEVTYPDPSLHGGDEASFTVANLLGVLRKAIEEALPSRGRKVLFLNEAITNFAFVWQHLHPNVPGSMLFSGGSSLGWGLGAAVGASLASQSDDAPEEKRYDLIVHIVGDGSFMFGVPSSVFWMARKYNTPFLSIVLNNGGWRSPKLSMLGVHPSGFGSQAISGDQLSVGFGPHNPNYSQIAVAASDGWAWGKKVTKGGKEALETAVKEALRATLEEKRCSVLDCVVPAL